MRFGVQFRPTRGMITFRPSSVPWFEKPYWLWKYGLFFGLSLCSYSSARTPALKVRVGSTRHSSCR